jgi:hypothetical protein
MCCTNSLPALYKLLYGGILGEWEAVVEELHVYGDNV